MSACRISVAYLCVPASSNGNDMYMLRNALRVDDRDTTGCAHRLSNIASVGADLSNLKTVDDPLNHLAAGTV